MKILILVDAYFPNTNSGARMMHDFALELLSRGHAVCVLTVDAELNKKVLISRENNFTLIKVRAGKIKGVSKFKRAFNEAMMGFLVWKRCKNFLRENPCDGIVYYAPTIFFGDLVKKIKTLWKVPSYLIIRDLFPKWAADVGLLNERSFIYRFFHHIEKKMYSSSDIIGVQSPVNLEYFSDKAWAKKLKFEVLFNWKTFSNTTIKKKSYRQRWGLTEKKIFIYGGNIGIAQDIDNILRLAKNLLKEKNIHFILVGNGSEIDRINRLIQREKLINVSVFSGMEHNDYLSLLSECDVGLISLNKNLTTHNFPGKMLDYMYLGLPMLASINPGNDLGDILMARNAGLVCVNGEDDRLVNCAMKLAHDKSLRDVLGNKGKNLQKIKFSTSCAVNQVITHFAQ